MKVVIDEMCLAVTIGKLIEAHTEHDEEKFLLYANLIADAYEESGEERMAKIIRNKISGECKKEPIATLNAEKQNKNFLTLLTMLGVYNAANNNTKYPYTVHDGKRYEGTIRITEGIGLHDGQGHKIEFR